MNAHRERLCTAPVALLLALSAACTYERDATSPQRSERQWTTVWEDDFDGASDEPPDPEAWAFDLGRGDQGWGNAELQVYTDRAGNVAQTGDGMLAITARAESLDGADFTSARIKTQGRYTFTYGRVEARIKLPRGAGIWPAFWMIGDDVTQVGLRACG